MCMVFLIPELLDLILCNLGITDLIKLRQVNKNFYHSSLLLIKNKIATLDWNKVIATDDDYGANLLYFKNITLGGSGIHKLVKNMPFRIINYLIKTGRIKLYIDNIISFCKEDSNYDFFALLGQKIINPDNQIHFRSHLDEMIIMINDFNCLYSLLSHCNFENIRLKSCVSSLLNKDIKLDDKKTILELIVTRKGYLHLLDENFHLNFKHDQLFVLSLIEDNDQKDIIHPKSLPLVRIIINYLYLPPKNTPSYSLGTINGNIIVGCVGPVGSVGPKGPPKYIVGDNVIISRNAVFGNIF